MNEKARRTIIDKPQFMMKSLDKKNGETRGFICLPKYYNTTCTFNIYYFAI